MTTCLIVEDSSVVREVIVRIVGELGFSVLEAEEAVEGVDTCKETEVDVVLLDWDLPSMGALDFLRGVGEMAQDKRPKIVLSATENDEKQFTLAQAAGACAHILKPFDREALAEVLRVAGVLNDGGPLPVEAVSLN